MRRSRLAAPFDRHPAPLHADGFWSSCRLFLRKTDILPSVSPGLGVIHIFAFGLLFGCPLRPETCSRRIPMQKSCQPRGWNGRRVPAVLFTGLSAVFLDSATARRRPLGNLFPGPCSLLAGRSPPHGALAAAAKSSMALGISWCGKGLRLGWSDGLQCSSCGGGGHCCATPVTPLQLLILRDLWLLGPLPACYLASHFLALASLPGLFALSFLLFTFRLGALGAGPLPAFPRLLSK